MRNNKNKKSYNVLIIVRLQSKNSVELKICITDQTAKIMFLVTVLDQEEDPVIGDVFLRL